MSIIHVLVIEIVNIIPVMRLGRKPPGERQNLIVFFAIVPCISGNPAQAIRPILWTGQGER